MSLRRRFSAGFKESVVRRMLTQTASIRELSEELGIHASQLFRWKQQMSHTAERMTTQDSDVKRNRRPQDWTPEEKLEAVMKSMRLTDAELGAFLRNQGLHKADLDEWRESVLTGARNALAGGGGAKSREQKRIRELERDLARKDKALAEASALLVLKKKAQAIWGAEDDDTEPTSER